jgi:toxin ParE1/3/4
LTVYTVLLTAGAERDLATIYNYIADVESIGRADRVLDGLVSLAEALAHSPRRGSRPRELFAVGNQEYRQVILKPYRVIYQVVGNRVYVHVIADGRRDMQSLLMRRLLGG